MVNHLKGLTKPNYFSRLCIGIFVIFPLLGFSSVGLLSVWTNEYFNRPKDNLLSGNFYYDAKLYRDTYYVGNFGYTRSSSEEFIGNKESLYTLEQGLSYHFTKKFRLDTTFGVDENDYRPLVKYREYIRLNAVVTLWNTNVD